MASRIQIGAAIAALALTSCSQKADGDPLYAGAECRRLTVIDEATGKVVVGAEDLAYDRTGRRVLISAYDRRAVEREAQSRSGDIEQGGIYAAPLDALKGEETSLTLASAVLRETVAGGLRPHGVSYDETRGEIMFVNRSYQKIDRKWRMTPRIERAGADGAVLVGDGGDPHCSANDVVMLGEKTFVSFDHAACGWRGGLEDVFASRASGLGFADGVNVFEGARHANGVVATADNRLALAATRDKAVLILNEKGEGFTVDRIINLPGAPDNLTLSEDGKIVAALHPSLPAIGAQRRLGIGRSGSRVVSIDPDSGETQLLFDDPRGRVFSAASAAIEEKGILVIGSVLDRGIVVCKRSDGAS